MRQAPPLDFDDELDLIDRFTAENKVEAARLRSQRREDYERLMVRFPNYRPVEHVVDNRVFLLGLDHMYRTRMRHHERTELLDCARAVASRLRVPPADVPIEGYYAESKRLTEYFRWMRRFQTVRGVDVTRVTPMREFQRLLAVASSPLYGCPIVGENEGILPVARDSLSHALHGTRGNPERLAVERLVMEAHAIAIDTNDISLVGLACLARDAVMLAALRETVVLYSGRSRLSRDEGLVVPLYVWNVDERLALRAARFVAAFNQLFDDDLPAPAAENADLFFEAADKNNVFGRCVCIAEQPAAPRFYHWAVWRRGKELEVRDFWDDEVVTTDAFVARSSTMPLSRASS